MLCCETCSVFRVDHWVRKSGHLYNRAIEQICMQIVTHDMEVGPQGQKNRNNYGIRVPGSL
jgi:hypothetical protein